CGRASVESKSPSNKYKTADFTCGLKAAGDEARVTANRQVTTYRQALRQLLPELFPCEGQIAGHGGGGMSVENLGDAQLSVPRSGPARYPEATYSVLSQS